jgi:hypothetical protein
MIDNEYYAV